MARQSQREQLLCQQQTVFHAKRNEIVKRMKNNANGEKQADTNRIVLRNACVSVILVWLCDKVLNVPHLHSFCHVQLSRRCCAYIIARDIHYIIMHKSRHTQQVNADSLPRRGVIAFAWRVAKVNGYARLKRPGLVIMKYHVRLNYWHSSATRTWTTNAN